MRENFSAVIGAKISEFRKKMAQVDRIVKRTAMETVKPIGANINRFRKQMAKVEATNKLLLKRSDKTIGADIREFMRKASLVAAATRALNKRVIIDIDARVNNFQRVIGKIANTIRSVDTVLLNGIGGSLVAMIPALVPMIAGLTGVIAMLGNMIGVVSGSTFALVSALFFAGTAAAAFGAIAIPTIMNVFGETEKLTKAQAAARAEFDKFTDTYKDIVKSLEQPVLDAFSKAMKIATRLLEMSRPLFEASATAMNNLLDAFNRTLDSKPMIAFFDYMNKAAGPLFEQVMKGIGWMVQGLLNMFVAFGPLAEATAKGFTDMNKRFADWAGNLGSNKGFQAFVDYVQENMPKVRAIFRDMISGTIRLFAAFSGQSGEMIDGFADMMARYKDWASNLGNNKQFQTFLDYIRKTGPGVLKFLGNFIKFIVNIGIGMAPLGAWLIKIANNFFEWANSMMKANPIIGMIFAAIVSLTGVFIALVPFLVAMRVLFAGFGKALMGFAKGALSNLAKAFKFLMGPIRTVALSLMILGKGALVAVIVPILAVIAVIALLVAVFVRLWKENEAFREGVLAVWEAIKTAITIAIDYIVQWITTVWGALTTWWDENNQTFYAVAQKVWDTVYTVITEVLYLIWDIFVQITNSIMDLWAEHGDLITAIIKGAWDIISEIIGNTITLVWNLIKAGLKFILGLFQSVWPIISGVVQIAWALIKSIIKIGIDFIAGIIDFFLNVFQGDWDGAFAAVLETTIKIWNTIVDTFEGIDLWQIGKDIVQGLINGITNMAGAVWDSVKSLANSIPSGIKSLLGIHSPSRVMEGISKWIPAGVASGINGNLNTIKSAMSKVKDATMFEPEQTNLSFGNAIDQGIQSIKHELEVTLNRLSGDTPVAAGGTTNTYNNERMLEGAIFQVREEADIEKVAKKLGDHMKHQAKSRGAGR